MRTIRCKGCGTILQNTKEDEMGYVNIIDESKPYCKRCFRLKHYNELPKIVASKENYESVIDNVLKKNGLIIYVVDLLDLASTLIPSVIDKLRNKDVILVGNKYDVFPHSTNSKAMVEKLSKMCEKKFFRVLATHLVSSIKGYFLDDLMNTIDLARKGRDVYFLGCANVGKSSLINSLLKRFTAMTSDVIATSVIPGTTLDEITIPFFEDNKAFIDTPGLINDANVLESLLPKSYLTILPKAEIKPKSYQLRSGNTILLAGLGGISILEGNTNATIYVANSLYIHRTKTENIQNMLDKHLGDILNPPTKEEAQNIKFKSKDFELKNLKYDICFPGIGFVSLSGNVKIRVLYLEKSEVYARESLIGGQK